MNTPSTAALAQTWHDEHARPLHRYVRGLTGDDQLTQDVVQETLLRAWQHPDVFERTPDSARAWLFTVARNLVIDHRRSARSRCEIGTEVVPEGSRAVSEAADHADATLDRWLIGDALAALTPQHRTMVVRAFYGGRTVTELADELGLPASTIRSRLHYGLRALRLALQERGVITA